MSVDTRPTPTNILRWPKTRDLITQQKFIYAHMYWNTDTSACGCYLYALEANAADLGMTPNSLEDAISEFVRRGLIAYDKDTGEIFVLDWPRWHIFKTPAALGALWSSIDKIQSRKLWITVKKAYESIPRPSKGKEEKNKDKSKTFSEEANFHSGNGSSSEINKPKRTSTGILCWTVDDESTATELERLYDREKILEAVEQLKTSRIDPLPSRVKKFMDDANPTRKNVLANWWASEEATLTTGKSLGIVPNRGESMDAYRNRIRLKLNGQ